MHFHTFFHPHVFPQIFSNNNFQFLNTCTKRAPRVLIFPVPSRKYRIFSKNKNLYYLLCFGFNKFDTLVQGWQWGRAGPKDGIFVPAPHGFFLSHPRPAPHDGENFLPHPRPLRPHEDPRSPALHRKTLFLVNFPYNYYHFFK